MDEMAAAGAANRRFHRVAFDGDAWLVRDGERTPCNLVDISLHGALVSAELLFEEETGVTLSIPLADDAGIEMRARVVRSFPADGQMSLETVSIDLDSIQQLRRLVELNLGDEAVLNRDLASLYGAA